MTRHFTVRRNVAASIFMLPWLVTELPAARTTSSPASEQFGAISRALVNLLRNPSSAAAVGGAYLRLRPADARVELLVNHICQGSIDQFLKATDDAAALKQLMRERQCRDFENGNTFKLEGCWMSLTEVRWLALAAVSSGSGR